MSVLLRKVEWYLMLIEKVVIVLLTDCKCSNIETMPKKQLIIKSNKLTASIAYSID